MQTLSHAMQRAFRENKAFLMRICTVMPLFIFAAHAFCFFNLTYSSDSVMLNAAKGREAQLAGGQYLLGLYWQLRGGISSPLWVGLLSTLYLTATAFLSAHLLSLRSLPAVFVLCGILAANSAVVSVCAASLHTADASFLAMMLAALAALLCMRYRFGTPCSALLIAAAAALDAAAPAFALTLMMLSLISDALSCTQRRALYRRTLGTMLSLLCGALVYLLGHAVMLRRNGLESTAVFHLPAGDSLSGAWLYPIQMLLSPLTAYTTLNVVLRIALLICTLFSLLFMLRRASPMRRFAVPLGVALLPLCANLPVFSGEPTGQTSLSFPLLDLLAAMQLLRMQSTHATWPRLLRRAAVACFGALFLGGIVFSNQVYLKKNLEYESTLSAMTRVLDRIEQTEGYTPGNTPVAIVGTLEDSVLSVSHQGFEHLSVLDAASNNYAAVSYEDNIWYTWQILGYPLNFISSHEQAMLEQSDAIQAMPSFPSEGCCCFVGDTLVIKLSSE